MRKKRFAARFVIECEHYPIRMPLNIFDHVYDPYTLFHYFKRSSNWKPFSRDREDLGARVTYHANSMKIEISINQYYTVLYRDLLFLMKKYPKCLKASKKSMEWLKVADTFIG